MVSQPRIIKLKAVYSNKNPEENGYNDEQEQKQWCKNNV
jgi:hypothetical protein